MMTLDDTTKGALCIALGVIVFLTLAGTLVVPILATLVSFMMINYGLKLRKMPPLFVVLQRWFDDVRYR